MSAWLALDSALTAIGKVLLVLLSMYGTGRLIGKVRILRQTFGSLPSIVYGIILYVLLAVGLSALGIMTRGVLSFLLLPGSALGFLYALRGMVGLSPRLPKPQVLQVILLGLAAYVISADLLDAARPEMRESDPLITYAVQPDRWLDEGRIYFLDETVFSAFPVLGEIISVWPAAMASNKIDQLILLQLFQTSLMLLAVVYSFRLLGVRPELRILVLFAVAACNLVVDHSTMAKTDMTAMLFLSIALSIQARRALDSTEEPDYSPYLAMGLALGSKLTAAPAVLPLALLVALNRSDRSPSRILRGTATALAFPLLFAMRTAWHTGSPFYPVARLNCMVRPAWKMPELHPLLQMRVDRTSELHLQPGILRGLLDMLRRWELALLLALSGIGANLVTGKRRPALIAIASVGGYAALATALFWPPWWGYKYTVLFLPFLAVLGGRLLSGYRRTAIGVSACSVILFLALFGRAGNDQASRSLPHGPDLIVSFVSGRWVARDYPALYFPPNAPLQLWARNKLPEGSTVVSLFVPTRYFSAHRTICAWRHPHTREIFADNGLRDEIDILQRARTDYVSFVREDPMPMSIETDLRILGRIGTGDVLEPMVKINGFVLCRFSPENLADSGIEDSPDPIPTEGYDQFEAGEGEYTVHISNGLTALGLVSLKAAEEGSSDSVDLLGNRVLFAGESLIWHAPPEAWSLHATAQNGGRYATAVSEMSGANEVRAIAIDLRIRINGPSTEDVGLPGSSLIMNCLPSANIVSLSAEGSELLEGRVLAPGEWDVIQMDSAGVLKAMDSDGCSYTIPVDALATDDPVWAVSINDMVPDFGL